MWLLSSENVLVDDERFPRELQVVIQQQAADYSECAHSCLHQVDCVLTDPESLCNDMTIADLTTCVVSGCGVDEAGQLAELAKVACGRGPKRHLLLVRQLGISASESASPSGSGSRPLGPGIEGSAPTESISKTGSSSGAKETSGADLGTDTDGSHKLSGGAIAGIVIGVILALAILGLVAFVFTRRRKQKIASGGMMAADDLPEMGEVREQAHKSAYATQEMDANAIRAAELDVHRSQRNVPELDGSPVPADQAHEIDSGVAYAAGQQPTTQTQPEILSPRSPPSPATSKETGARAEEGDRVMPTPSSMLGTSVSPLAGTSPVSDPTEQYEALRRAHAKLEARRKRLQELQDVETQQQALLERMEQLKPGGGGASSG